MELSSLPGRVCRDMLRRYQILEIGAELIDSTSSEPVNKENAVRTKGTNVDLMIPEYARCSDGTGNERGLAV